MEDRSVEFTVTMPDGRIYETAIPLNQANRILQISRLLEIGFYSPPEQEENHDDEDLTDYLVHLEETIIHTVTVNARDRHEAQDIAMEWVQAGTVFYDTESRGDLHVMDVTDDF